jgi:hypothetical protein
VTGSENKILISDYVNNADLEIANIFNGGYIDDFWEFFI